MQPLRFFLLLGKLISNFTLIYNFISFRSDYMFVTQIERLGLIHWTSTYCQNTHTCKIMRSVNTEVLRFIIRFHLPIIDPSDCFYKIDHSSSFIWWWFIYKLTIDIRPNPFILMHMGSNVEINHTFSIELGWEIIIEIRHISKCITTMWVDLGAHDGVVRCHDGELRGELVTF